VALITRRIFLALSACFVPALGLAQSKAVSLAEFMELSERLVGRPKLDPEVGQIYLNALLADADDAIYLATLVQMNGNPTPEQRVLSQTIVEWWYTGVYTLNGKPRLATHTGALMWNAMDMPAPGTCVGPFGAWSKPPRSLA
jgi:Membrane bound FAD containing D-sorbitol dehydrogenase